MHARREDNVKDTTHRPRDENQYELDALPRRTLQGTILTRQYRVLVQGRV